MLTLDRSLAQAIVDRSMTIIDGNVIVMDASGVIIASGDPARLGTLHEGALLAYSKRSTVEIDAHLEHRLSGVRQGVNLPLRTEGRIVGCVGLSGTPQTVRQHGELVRMAAETMLEQAYLMRLLARDARMREELVLALVRESPLTPELTEWAQRLGIDTAMPRVAVAIEIERGTLEVDQVIEEVQRLHTLLSTPERNNLIATVSLTELVVLTPALNRRGEWDVDVQRQRVKNLLARMRESSPLGIRLALGHYFPGVDGLARSYRVAKATLKVGKQRRPREAAHFYADLALPVLLDGLREGWQAEQLNETLRPLLDHNRQEQLLRTLRAWFAHGMQMSTTAQALHVHRNTLDYRMHQIQDLCGVDLSVTEDCMRLYLALHMIDPA
ncbi:sugar diacid recognition domain-containing protein [Azospirillum sp. TSO22-1]|uniref:sugar diacid recognition domain-containing protein n=1 Tax=Azospirillum sp. TSO22-1 TaxID=716789 RepID=UPI000D607B13|nr:sugar diacid recognition domain-containing protein [Azospirillum sp. TSO22-1]PWC45835.1 transcriptional regulator [Azospirillum sp. TSO22-1]